MRYQVCALFVALLLTPAVGKCETGCPFLNRATVAGLLASGNATEGHHSVREAQPCFFHYRLDNVEYNIRIEVSDGSSSDIESMLLQSGCTSKRISLQAIGNETVLCDSDIRPLRGEQVAGLVRDRVFLVRMTSSGAKSGTLGRKALREAAMSAARQVAGNLF
jgi:hypothetical protein